MRDRLAPFLVLALSGCIGLPAEGVLEEASTSLNGTSLNGTSLNGTSLNGTSLNGTSLNGTSLNGTSLNGTSLNGVTLNATVITATTSTGNKISGSGLVGSLWSGTSSNGAAVTLRIDSVSSGSGTNADLTFYGVSYQSSTGWSRLCGSDTAGAAILAIPVPGVWNYSSGVAGGGGWTADSTRFTFGCRLTAIAKCVELGYRPWKTIPGGTGTLQNHLTACTRLLRADYCGDGSSYTVTGTLLNLYDAVGIQLDTQSWPVEAEWTAAGARCVSASENKRFLLLRGQPPACFGSRVQLGCGTLTDFQTGTLLIDEYSAN